MKEINVKKSIRKFQSDNSNVKNGDIIEFTYKISDFLNREIFKKVYRAPLPKSVMVIDEMLKYTLGTYRPRTAIGFSNQITLNVNITGNYTMLSAVIFHEMVHEYLDIYDPLPARTKSYHCNRFKKLSEPYSPTDKEGRFKGITQLFFNMIQKSGLLNQTDNRLIINSKELEKLLLNPKPPKEKKQKTKNKKWSCKCTNIRCAVFLDATCDKCGQKFIKS